MDPAIQVPYPNPLNGAWKERALQAGSNVLAIPSFPGHLVMSMLPWSFGHVNASLVIDARSFNIAMSRSAF